MELSENEEPTGNTILGKDCQLRNRMFNRIKIFCGDNGLSYAIEANLKEIYKWYDNVDTQMGKHIDEIVLTVNFTGEGRMGLAAGAAAQMSGNYASMHSNSPHIDIPSDAMIRAEINEEWGYDEEENPAPMEIDLYLTEVQAAILLHEINHVMHIYVDNGVYRNPVTRKVFGPNARVVATRQGTFESPSTKADELETYWRSCINANGGIAGRYIDLAVPFGDKAKELIKSVNNVNMNAYDSEFLFKKDWLGKDEKYIDDDKMSNSADIYDLNRIDPRENHDYVPQEGERDPNKYASRQDVLNYILSHPEWKYGHKIL